MPTHPPMPRTDQRRTDELAPGDLVATGGGGIITGYCYRWGSPAARLAAVPAGLVWRTVEDVVITPADRASDPDRIVWFTDGTKAETRTSHRWSVQTGD